MDIVLFYDKNHSIIYVLYLYFILVVVMAFSMSIGHDHNA